MTLASPAAAKSSPFTGAAGTALVVLIVLP